MKLFYKLGRANIKIGLWLTSKHKTMGVYDWVKGGYHVLFLDYDNIHLEWLIDELKRIQEQFHLSNFYLFHSSFNSYHAVCFDVLTASDCQKIIMQTNCDETFKKAMFYDHCSRVLRVHPKGHTAKPIYKGIIPSNYRARQKSTGHMKFFAFNYNMNNIDCSNENNIYDIKLINYPTKKNV